MVRSGHCSCIGPEFGPQDLLWVAHNSVTPASVPTPFSGLSGHLHVRAHTHTDTRTQLKLFKDSYLKDFCGAVGTESSALQAQASLLQASRVSDGDPT